MIPAPRDDEDEDDDDCCCCCSSKLVTVVCVAESGDHSKDGEADEIVVEVVDCFEEV